MRVSVELVPRQKDTFVQELELVKRNFPAVETINIPDISRYQLRSWQAAELAKPLFSCVIPHLKAIEVEKGGPIPYSDFLNSNNINEVLVVLGDNPHDPLTREDTCTSIDLIKMFKAQMPEIKVYAALDQYRNDLNQECEYARRKIDAGADGFFTQPFFDMESMQLYSEKLKGINVFWGVSPVTSERSKRYWQENNKVVFPPGFIPTMEWNKEFTKRAFEFVKKNDSNIYLMPIKTDILEYLSGVL